MIITCLIIMIRGTLKIDRKFRSKASRVSHRAMTVEQHPLKKYEGPFFSCDIRLGGRFSQLH